jgi:hypothetical protein
MAEKPPQKDLLARIADASEDALNRLASSGSADRVLGMFGSMKEQVDALSQKVRGIDQLEKRVDALEKKVEQLSTASSSAPARKTSSARKPSTSSSRKTSSGS